MILNCYGVLPIVDLISFLQHIPTAGRRKLTSMVALNCSKVQADDESVNCKLTLMGEGLFI